MEFRTSLASTFNASFVATYGGVAGAEAALAASLEGGAAYFNIHTTLAPAGEIRGFFAEVPEPGAGWLLAVGGPALLLAWRRRRSGGSREPA